MKKTLILLLFCAPMVLFAQTRGKDTGGKSKTTSADTNTKEKPLTKAQYNEQQAQERAAKKAAKIVSEWVFVEAVYLSSTGPVSIKLDLANSKDVILDKNMSLGLNNVKTRRFTAVAEFFNVMGSLGFELVTSFVVPSRGQEEIHFVFKAANNPPEVSSTMQDAGNTMSKKNPGLSTKKK